MLEFCLKTIQYANILLCIVTMQMQYTWIKNVVCQHFLNIFTTLFHSNKSGKFPVGLKKIVSALPSNHFSDTWTPSVLAEILPIHTDALLAVPDT